MGVGHSVARVSSALVVAASLQWAATVAADDGVSNPRQTCEELGLAIGDKDAGKLSAVMLEGSRSMMDRNATIAASEQVVAAARLQGSLRYSEFMAEREYGERVRRVWYVLLFDAGQPFYLHCQFVKPDDLWQLVDFDFNTDLDKVPIP